MIVCESADRISRRPAQLDACLRLAADHGVAILFADDFTQGSVPPWPGLAYAMTVGLAFPCGTAKRLIAGG